MSILGNSISQHLVSQRSNLCLLSDIRHLTSTEGDYTSLTQVVIIPASSGPSTTCFNISITDDEIVENDEEFLVSFEIPPGTNANTGMINTTHVVIVDDDGKILWLADESNYSEYSNLIKFPVSPQLL